MSANIMTITNVATLVSDAKSTAPRTRGEAYAIIVACDNRLKQAAEGTLVLAEGVRLPLEGVVRVLWKLRKTALAQWKAAKAAAEAQSSERTILDDMREAAAI